MNDSNALEPHRPHTISALQAVYRGLDTPVAVLDDEDRILLVNEALARALDPSRAAAGARFERLLGHRTERAGAADVLARARTDRDLEKAVLALAHPAAGALVVRASASPLTPEAPDDQRVVLVLRPCDHEDLLTFCERRPPPEMFRAGTPCRQLLDGAQRLTEREMETFSALARGAAFDATAERMEVSEYTLRNHTRAIYRKLEIGSRDELYGLLSSVCAHAQTCFEGQNWSN